VGPQDLAKRAIRSDAEFVGRLVSNFQAAPSNVGGLTPLCMAAFLSLFVYESARTLEKIDSNLAFRVSSTAQAVIERSRHSLKLFEDNKRGLEGQLLYFERDLIPAHSAEFLGKSALPGAASLETDLGVFTYEGVPVGSTHSGAFALGRDAAELYGNEAGPLIQETAEEYGQFFAVLGAKLQPDARTFVTSMHHITTEDVRASRYYSDAFNGTVNANDQRSLVPLPGVAELLDRGARARPHTREPTDLVQDPLSVALPRHPQPGDPSLSAGGRLAGEVAGRDRADRR
jgi:hypothetical protein